MKLFTLMCGAAFSWTVAHADAPSGYYSSCEGKTGQSLLTSLYSTITNHTVISYDGLWDLYNTSDVRDDGTIWDMYSTKHWTPGKQKCGNYSLVGDCYNREHSMPKSWFNDAKPMYSDAFHLYPTDGKVNGQRSNYPFGECSGGTTLPSNGNVKALGRLGTSTFSGYSGKVFEPDDEYKGDFARSYFYMAACYNDRISSWNSDMLAGNKYPVFSSWALNLLLKWHRQDPVSEKELRRNEVVYGSQKNRNPFIDHPELVEYVWGNKVGSAWHEGGDIDPIITLPTDGSSLDMGVAAVNITRTATIAVKGTALTQNVTATISGNGFKVTPSSLTATAVNNGSAQLTVSFLATTPGKSTGSLVLRSGNTKSTVALSIETLDGLPAGNATSIYEDSFFAHWTCVNDPDDTYTISVYLNDELLPGYPVEVSAGSESYLVEGLQPETTYTYTVSNGTLTSNVVTVTTSAPLPSIQFLYDGELILETLPGTPSDPAELLLDIENISTDIVISVSAPFQVSTDKTNWHESITLTPDEDRFYLRLFGQVEGNFATSLTATAGDYINDDVTVEGVIASETPAFLETFETEPNGSYNKPTFTGVATIWNLNDVGLWSDDKPHSGELAARFGKSATSSIATASPKEKGIGTVSFWAAKWNNKNDGAVTLVIEYSADGNNWTSAGSVVVEDTDYTKKSVTVNQTGNLYLRIRQTAGARMMLDDIEVSNYLATTAVKDLEYHSWDAFCRDGVLVIENDNPDNNFTIYSIDGIVRYEGCIGESEFTISLTPGLYIVAVNDFSRRVVVK